MESKTKHIGMAVATVAALVLTVGMAQAVFSGESFQNKMSRLDTAYADQTEIITRADEVIEKQFDIKMRAERSLKSITIDLASLKVQAEMQKDDPDLAEISRLSEKAALYAKELGN